MKNENLIFRRTKIEIKHWRMKNENLIFCRTKIHWKNLIFRPKKLAKIFRMIQEINEAQKFNNLNVNPENFKNFNKKMST